MMMLVEFDSTCRAGERCIVPCYPANRAEAERIVRAYEDGGYHTHYDLSATVENEHGHVLARYERGRWDYDAEPPHPYDTDLGTVLREHDAFEAAAARHADAEPAPIRPDTQTRPATLRRVARLIETRRRAAARLPLAA